MAERGGLTWHHRGVHDLPDTVKVFLVGGAVRDRLLGRRARERDWVVVGADAEMMRNAGFKQVGRDFPVFLHPVTGEEYALARTERKTGRGHQAFAFDTAASVTLEEDLLRRDLTINAIAEDAEGRLIDPCEGREDLERHWLRHVSPAFVEDPLRVFRVARFTAQLADYGFIVAPETLALMREMAAAGELAELSAERVFAELDRALVAAAPACFFGVLADADALVPWFSEVDCETALPVLDQVTHAGLDSAICFACLCTTLLPAAALALAKRLRAPRLHQDLGVLAATHADAIADLAVRAAPDDADALLALLNATDAWRRGERFEALVNAVSWARGVAAGWLCELAAHVRSMPVSTPPGGGAAARTAVIAQRRAAIASWLQAASDETTESTSA